MHQHSSRQCNGYGLGTGNAVDTIHEIEEVEHPEHEKNRDQIPEPTDEMDSSRHLNGVHTAHPAQGPDSHDRLHQETPARGDMAMIIDEPDRRQREQTCQRHD